MGRICLPDVRRVRATSRSGAIDVCSKVTPVKSIYLLNVVLKQESLTKTRENKTGDVSRCDVDVS